jgi:hypothetical protein
MLLYDYIDRYLTDQQSAGFLDSQARLVVGGRDFISAENLGIQLDPTTGDLQELTSHSGSSLTMNKSKNRVVVIHQSKSPKAGGIISPVEIVRWRGLYGRAGLGTGDGFWF